MKKILLLVHAPQTRPGHLNWVALRDLLQETIGQDVKVDISALSELLLMVDGSEAHIRDDRQNYDVSDFDLVVFRTIGKETEAAISVAAYCRKRGIPYIDQCVPTTGDNKIACVFVRWEHGLPVPPSAYGPISSLEQLAKAGTFGWPLVAKSNNGKKGRDNFLVNDVAELNRALNNNPEVRFIMQRFIPNTGDYRILTLNGQPRMAILRTAAADTHLNNTSQGGEAKVVSLSDMPEEILELSRQSANLEKLAIAGVDIVVDSQTKKPYILEVNKSPQLATGFEVKEKMRHYADALRELLDDNNTEKDQTE